jgi:hypothetical protein
MGGIMNRRIVQVVCCLSILSAWSAIPSHAAEKRFGVGVHYWETVSSLADKGFGHLKDNGTSWLVSYQVAPRGLFTFEADLEYFNSGFGGSDESTFSPQFFVLVGHGLYAGVGIGANASNGFGNVLSDPFYIGRAGFNFELVPRLYIDVNANYQVDAFNQLSNTNTDAITLGAMLRWDISSR